MNIVLFDDQNRDHFLPLVFTRPVCEIRMGILTIREKWERLLKAEASFLTAPYLQKKYPLRLSSDNLFINGAVLPDASLAEAVEKLENGFALQKDDLLIAFRADEQAARAFTGKIQEQFKEISYSKDLLSLKHLPDIFSLNEKAILADFGLITDGRKSQPLPDGNQVLNSQAVFIEEGAKISCSMLNASAGPIYIGKDAEVMEGSMIRGPFALGTHGVVKMGAKIYGATTIGPHSKVGGEINNSVIFGYSNKAHDGFLGNAVVGEWCNIGADSNNSNLKNNYAEVRLWNYHTANFRRTGLQFCGLIMADHAKCGINTMFNTGTVVGVASNIFGPGFPRNFIPDFSWGGAQGFETYQLAKAIEVATLVYERRQMLFNETEREILSAIFEQTEAYRKF